MEPAQVRLGGGPAIAVFVEARDGAVVNHFALLVAPAAINHLSLGHFVNVARDDAVHQLGSVAPGDQVLVQRRDVNQRRCIADSVVLVLMVHLIHADRVISRPLAIIEALAEREGAFVKGGSDGHDFLFNSKLRIIPTLTMMRSDRRTPAYRDVTPNAHATYPGM